MPKNTFLNDIKRLKNIADIGLLYAKDGYDQERYEELREISISMLAKLTDTPLSIGADFFKKEADYPTPKVDIRALVLNEKQEILMVREQRDGKWSLPGGWADIGLTPKEVAAKEVLEETGLVVIPDRLMAVFDKKCHPHPPEPFYVYKMVILCHHQGGDIKIGFDVLEGSFFSINNLPPLSENRILKSQIECVYQKVINHDATPYLD